MGLIVFITCIFMSAFQVADDVCMPNDELHYSFDSAGNVSLTDILPPHFFATASSAQSLWASGDSPEGDGLIDVLFNNDGSKLFVANFLSNNITVIDWATKKVDTTFSVGDSPASIACTDDYIVVAIPFTNGSAEKIEIYKLSDYSLAASFKTLDGGDPWIVKTSDDGKYACVSITPVSKCLIIDMTTLKIERVIDDFATGFITIFFPGLANRLFLINHSFKITPGGTHIITQNSTETRLNFINISTGQVEKFIPVDRARATGISGDGKYLIVQNSCFPLTMLKINISTFTIESTVDIAGYRLGDATEIAVNYDGSKACVAGSDNSLFMVRFETNDYIKFGVATTESSVYLQASHDHSMVISGTDGNVSLLDFEKEIFVTRDTKVENCLLGCTSPVDNSVAILNPRDSDAILCYSFTKTTLKNDAIVLSGSPVEGDGTVRVKISPDGSVAVVSHPFSNSISIIDMHTLATKAHLEIGRVNYRYGSAVKGVAITSDSKWAVVCGGLTNAVTIVNLETNTIVASIPTGGHCATATITPNDEYAYITGILNYNVAVIRLNGPSSSKVTSISCPGIATSFKPGGSVDNAVAISPDGTCALVPAAVMDAVYVIDTSTNKVISTLDVGNFPLRVCFNSDGSKALVSNFADDTYSLLNIDGASSSVIATRPSGDRPTWVVFNPVAQAFEMAIFEARKVIEVDQNTGAIKNTFKYPGRIINLAYTAAGERMVLSEWVSSTVPRRLYRGNNYVNLYGAPFIHFDYSDAADAALLVAPGPDYIYHIAYDPTGISHQNTVVADDIPVLAVSPNPGADHFAFDISLPSASHIDLAVYDLNGRKISSIQEDSFTEGSHSFNWNTELPTGVYAIKLDACEKSVTRLFTVCR